MAKQSCALGLIMLMLLGGSAYAQNSKQADQKQPSPREMEALKEHAKGTEQMLGKNFKDAIVSLKRALELNPDFAEAYYNLGISYEELGKYEDSVEALQQAIKRTPDNANAHYALGYAYYQLKRYQDSIGAFERSIALKPSNAFARSKLGYAYLAVGNRDKAQEQYLALKTLNAVLAEDLYRDIAKGEK